MGKILQFLPIIGPAIASQQDTGQATQLMQQVLNMLSPLAPGAQSSITGSEDFLKTIISDPMKVFGPELNAAMNSFRNAGQTNINNLRNDSGLPNPGGTALDAFRTLTSGGVDIASNFAGKIPELQMGAAGELGQLGENLMRLISGTTGDIAKLYGSAGSAALGQEQNQVMDLAAILAGGAPSAGVTTPGAQSEISNPSLFAADPFNQSLTYGQGLSSLMSPSTGLFTPSQ